jgi:PAS domain S-box-containing protein
MYQTDKGQRAAILLKKNPHSKQRGAAGQLPEAMRPTLAGIPSSRSKTHPALPQTDRDLRHASQDLRQCSQETREPVQDTRDDGQDLRYAKQELQHSCQNTRETTQNTREACRDCQFSGQEVADIHTRYQLLVNSVTDYALYMLDPEGCVVTWNAGAERLKGYTAEEILGRKYSVFFLPEDVEAGVPARELEEASRVGRYEVEAWRLRKDGTKFWALLTLTAIRDRLGELRGFAKVTRDMTVHKAAQEVLRAHNASLERYRIIVENIDEYYIYSLDAEGRITGWESGAQKQSGTTPEEILGRSYSMFFSPEDVLNGVPERYLAEAARAGQVKTDSWMLTPKGERVWISGVLNALRDEEGRLTGFIRVSRDMTHQKLLQDALVHLAAELEDRVQERTAQLEANMEELRRKNAEVQASAQIVARDLEEKKVLFGEIHHRVKNNLQVVQSLLKMQVRVLAPSEARAAIEATILRVRSMATVHERLYQMPNLADLPLAEFLRDIFNGAVASYSIQSGRIKFHLHAEEIRLNVERAVPFGLLANELLSNSFKHAFPAGKKGTISVSVHRAGDAVRMIVQDSGVGLPENFDVASSKSMGLKLAQSLAHQLGGTLQFTSGRGCHVEGVFTRL